MWVCRSISCAACGGEELLEYLCERLGIRPGETTADGRVTLGVRRVSGGLRLCPGHFGERYGAWEYDEGKIDELWRREHVKRDQAAEST